MTKSSLEEPKVNHRLVHGLYARDVLLPWESRDDFDQLYHDLKVEFSPDGRAEEETVLDLAMGFWHKRTLWRLRNAAILEDPDTASIVKTGAKSWTGIRKGLRKAAREDRSELSEAEEDLAAMVADVVHSTTRLVRKIGQASPDHEKLARKLNSISQALKAEVFPMIKALQERASAVDSFRRAYAPESLAKLLQLEAAIDARINKALARLVGLKEFKRTPAGSRGAVTQLAPP